MQWRSDSWLGPWLERIWEWRAVYVRHFVTGFVFGVVFSAGAFGG